MTPSGHEEGVGLRREGQELRQSALGQPARILLLFEPLRQAALGDGSFMFTTYCGSRVIPCKQRLRAASSRPDPAALAWHHDSTSRSKVFLDSSKDQV